MTAYDDAITAALTARLADHRWTVDQLVTVCVALDIHVHDLLGEIAPPSS